MYIWYPSKYISTKKDLELSFNCVANNKPESVVECAVKPCNFSIFRRRYLKFFTENIRKRPQHFKLSNRVSKKGYKQ